MATSGRFVLALDEGTTSTRALVFDGAGRIRAESSQELRQYYPRPGWVEHDAEEIWLKTLAAARAALRKARVTTRDLASLGITNQRETVVAWDARTLRPLAPAIVWQCRRTADDCRRFKAQDEEGWIRAKTGLLLDPYFSGTKIRWLLKQDAKVRRARRDGRLRFGTIDSWLVARLTEGTTHATDVSNASRTLLMDLRRGDWDPELLRFFGARAEELPAIVDSSGVLGEASGRWLGRPVPIAGIAGDQQAALFGQACLRPGMAKNTYGTGCFALINAGDRAPRPGAGILATSAWRIRGRDTFALEGSIFVAGAAIQWLRDELGLIRNAEESEALARSVRDTGDVFLVPAFVGLGAPHWDPFARGLLVGLTRGTNRRHIVRAALESIAHQSADVLDALARSSGRRLLRLRADGGATANGFLMQLQADLLGVRVEVPRVKETTAQGAAFLAGLGSGLWATPDEVGRLWRPARTFRSGLPKRERDFQRARWHEAVKRTLGGAST